MIVYQYNKEAGYMKDVVIITLLVLGIISIIDLLVLGFLKGVAAINKEQDRQYVKWAEERRRDNK